MRPRSPTGCDRAERVASRQWPTLGWIVLSGRHNDPRQIESAFSPTPTRDRRTSLRALVILAERRDLRQTMLSDHGQGRLANGVIIRQVVGPSPTCPTRNAWSGPGFRVFR